MGDIDGDGFGDIALDPGLPRGLTYQTSDGSRFAPPRPASWLRGGPAYFRVLCDIDGDGRLDLVGLEQLRSKAEALVVHPQANGATITIRYPDPPDDGREPIGLYCGDVDGDGRADLAVASVDIASGRRVEVMVARQRAQGRWSGLTPWLHVAVSAHGLQSPPTVQMGDWNGDGRSDLVLRADIPTHGDRYDVLWFDTYLSTGARFALTGRRVTISKPPLEPGRNRFVLGDEDEFDAVAADVDGDGRDELVRIGTFGWAQAYHFTGSGWEAASSVRSWLTTSTAAITAADVDGDGTTDVVAATNNHRLEVYLGSRAGLRPPVVWSGSAPRALATMDEFLRSEQFDGMDDV